MAGSPKPPVCLDRLRRGVVLAGEAEHGAGHGEAGGLGGRGHGVALVPGGVVRVAAGDLHDVDAEAAKELLQFGDALDLERPAAHADGERFERHGDLRGVKPVRWNSRAARA